MRQLFRLWNFCPGTIGPVDHLLFGHPLLTPYKEHFPKVKCHIIGGGVGDQKQHNACMTREGLKTSHTKKEKNTPRLRTQPADGTENRKRNIIDKWCYLGKTPLHIEVTRHTPPSHSRKTQGEHKSKKVTKILFLSM